MQNDMYKEKERATATKEMQDALDVAKQFIDEYDGADKQRIMWVVFKSLVAISEQEGNEKYFEAKKPEELIFDKQEIIGTIRTQFDSVSDDFKVERHIKSLVERLKELQPSLEMHARKLNKNVFPSIYIDKSSGGKGKKTRYAIKPISIGVQTEVDTLNDAVQAKKTSDEISYEVESELPTLPIWARWLYPIIKRKWLVITLGVSPAIALLFMCVMAASTTTIALTSSPLLFIIPLLYIGCYWLFFRFFTVVLNNNISMLPDILLPLRLESAVLEVELNPPKSNLPLKKAVKLKVYRATCPVCGHRVSLHKRAFYSEDIIGVCSGNPRMHRYSFDFTTQSGELLKKM